MHISRRSFLGGLSASVAAVFSFVGRAEGESRAAWLLGLSPLVKGDALAQLSWRSFYNQLYTDFEFSSLQTPGVGKRPRAFQLAEMKNADLGGKKSPDDPQCFVLTFRANAVGSLTPLRQDTYAVEHFALGRFDLFISEGSFMDGEFVHTAVINRSVG